MKKVLFPLGLAVVLAVPIHAAELTWTTDGSGNWSNGGGGWTSTGGATTWSNATPDAATIGKGGTAGTISLTSAITAASITFGTVTGNYTVQNNTLTLANGGAVTVNDDSATINSVIAGVSPVKQGTGNLNLGGANTFTGTFGINAGIVDVGGAGQALGLGSVVVNNAELAAGNSSASGMFSAVSSITLNSGTVRTRDSSNRTFGGNFVLGSGTSTFIVQKNNSSDNQTHTFGTLSIGNAQLSMTPNLFGAGVATAAFGATTLTGDATFSSSINGSSTGQISLGALNDSGTARTLTKSGNGTLTLNNNATSMVDGTQVNVTAGTLNSNSATALGSLAKVDVGSGGVFNAGAAQTIGSLSGSGTTTLGGTLTIGSTNNLSSSYSGVISGGQAVVKAGSGTLALSGSNSFTGQLSILAGTLSVPTANNASTVGPLGNSGNAVNFSGTQGTSATFLYTGITGTTNKTLNLGTGGSSSTRSATGIFNIESASANLSLTGAIGGFGSLTKTGPGTLTLATGNNNWFGDLAVNGGRLVANAASGASDPVNGVLGQYKNGATSRQVVVNNGGILDFATGNVFGTDGSGNQIFITINQGGQLVSTPAAGSNFFQQIVTINGGTLTTGNGVDANNQSYRLNNNITTGGSAVSTINAGGSTFNGINLRNGSATTFTVGDATGDAGADLIVSASLVNSSGGNGQVTKAGAGTMLLSGSNSYTSTTAVSAGVLQLGNANALGTVSGSTTVAAGAALDLNGQTIGAEPMNISGTGINNGGALINTNTGTAASLAGNVTLTGTTSIGGAGNVTVTGTLIGSAATNRLVKTGTGTLTLTGTAGSNRGASTATTQIDGGVLRLNNALALNTSVSTGTATVNSGGTLELGTGITYNQGVALNDGGAFRSDGNNTFGTGGGVIGVANTGSPGVTLATVSLSDVFSISGRISGGTSTSTINISGPGNVDVLGSSNDYVGNWKVNAGVLRLGTTAALGAGTSPTITLNGGSIAGRLASNTTFTPSNNVVVTADSGVISDRSASGAGVTYTFGPLSIGSNQLTVSTSAAATSGTGGIVVGATTLSGNPTFNVTNGATAATSFTAGALNDSGVARTITKSGNGTMTLGTAATSLVNGTQVNVTGGTLNSNNATALGNLAAVSVSGGANLVVGASQTVGSLAGAGVVNIGANTLTVGSSNNLSSTYGGAIAGTGGSLTKAGSGTLTLSGTNTYTGATAVNAGTLLVASTGRLSNTSGVTVASGAEFVYNNNTTPFAGAVTVTGVLGGNGRLAGTINGSGLVGPGNSPGVLTVGQIDGSGGLDFAFEFTSTGSPNYGNNSASINDVLRTTDGTPFASALDSNNTINVYLNVASITGGDVFKGGFYTDTNADFFSSISAATYQYYVANIAGAISYNGVNYDLYTGPLLISVAAVSEAADFGGGNVNGWVTEFTVVPEPATWALASVGAMAVLFGRRRRQS